MAIIDFWKIKEEKIENVTLRILKDRKGKLFVNIRNEETKTEVTIPEDVYIKIYEYAKRLLKS